MEQILVTIDDTQPSASIRNAIKMLRGVVSASIIKESPLTIEEKQKAYVKESLSRALQEVKFAKLQGKKLQDIDDFIREMKEAQPMEVNISTGSEFKRQFKRLMKKYHSLLYDFEVQKQELKNNPLAGDDLGAGVRKIRMAINSKGKGKSGGARILTLNILLDAETMDITLLTIYDKGEISNVNDDYIKFLVENL